MALQDSYEVNFERDWLVLVVYRPITFWLWELALDTFLWNLSSIIVVFNAELASIPNILNLTFSSPWQFVSLVFCLIDVTDVKQIVFEKLDNIWDSLKYWIPTNIGYTTKLQQKRCLNIYYTGGFCRDGRMLFDWSIFSDSFLNPRNGSNYHYRCAN